MLRFALPAVIGLASLAAPAFAAEPQAASSAPAPNIVVQGEQDPKQRKVCKSEVATGSVMPKRVCRMVSTDPAVRLQEQRQIDIARERQQTGQSTTEIR